MFLDRPLDYTRAPREQRSTKRGYAVEHFRPQAHWLSLLKTILVLAVFAGIGVLLAWRA
jgi:hypothetical protein